MDLAEFLLARIGEDAAQARAALAWLRADSSERWQADDGAVLDGQGDAMAGYVGEDVAPHIARWDPARVLAECEAKRRIVEAWQVREQGHPGPHDAPDPVWPGDDPCERCQEWWRDHPDIGTYALILLAAPYASHSDYRPGWAPTVTV